MLKTGLHYLQVISNCLYAPLRTGWELIIFGLICFWLNWYFTDYPRPDFWPWFFILGIDLYVVAAILHRLPRGWRMGIKGIWHTTAYALAFTESFLYKRFYIIYAPTALTLALETNGGEASEFLNSCLQSNRLWPTLWPWLLLISAHIGVVIARRWLPSPRIHFTIRHILSVAILAYLAWLMPNWFVQRSQIAEFVVASDSGEAEKASSGLFYSAPLRLLNAAKFYKLAQDEMDVLANNMKSIAVDSITDGCPTIVLIIGESYNKHHSQVYGYELPTTPYEQRFIERGTMVAFADVVSPWNLTSNVFKNMLSTHSVDQRGTWTNGVLFPAIFRKAGYHVSFITNQFQQSNRQNKADFNGSFFLNDVRFDSLCFDSRNTKKYKYDSGMIRELSDSFLDSITKPHLLIFHLMGQHLTYSERTPQAKIQFHAEDYNRPDLTRDERQIIADYDNATLFNDEVVARVCGKFKDAEAIVIYLADHGDEVFDGNIGMFGRNHRADITPEILRGEFEVPFEIWASRKFRRRHQALWNHIRKCSDRPFMTDDLPHLLFGLAGIHCPQYDATRDLLSPSFNPSRKRLVKDGAADYDAVIKSQKAK